MPRSMSVKKRTKGNGRDSRLVLERSRNEVSLSVASFQNCQLASCLRWPSVEEADHWLTD